MSCAILMCTFNGEEYVIEQIRSIVQQEYKGIQLYISDDGSSDLTISIIERYIKENSLHNVILLSGPKKGYANNFMSMIYNNDIRADYYAYSDQDDIWDKDKISAAILELERVPEGESALYCTRTKLVDQNNNYTGMSKIFRREPLFKNAIVQSIAGGNTMVMNNSAREAMARYKVSNIVSHDWWSYIVISAIDGVILYNSEARIRYRQHDQNVIGENRNILSKIKRILNVLNGNYKKMNSKNINELIKIRGLMSTGNKEVLDCFIKAREGLIITRIVNGFKSGVYRQVKLESIALYLAIIAGRV
jgi:glycosyltransferase involved in cell wall biosynthesis